MKCLECGKRTLKTQAMCWSQWQLCGDCGPIKHPDKYHLRQINSTHNQ